jgi:predicted ATP-dependent protease
MNDHSVKSEASPQALQPCDPPFELSYDALRYEVPGPTLDFRTTRDVEAEVDDSVQERALAALEMGLHVRHAGYNVYVCGLSGTHRERDLASLLRRFTADLPSPGDRVLVQNFGNPDKPRAFRLPAGLGVSLRNDMIELVEEIRAVLPRIFRDERFEDEKEKLAERFGERGTEIQLKISEQASEAGFALRPGSEPGEIVFVPLKDGNPMSAEDLEALGEKGHEELYRRQRELGRQIKAFTRQQQALLRDLSREVKKTERRVAADAIRPLIDELRNRYSQEEVQAYLQDVLEHILENLTAFQEQPLQQPSPFALPFGPTPQDALLNYAVNVLVDNGSTEGPPIIFESWPTYKNLFGAVERMVDPHGKLISNFTRVTAGSLLRADGGCVILNVREVLSEPLVWRALKECLKSGELEIEAYDPFALFSTTALKPEPMQIETRVVLTGPEYLFQLLYFVDDDFKEIFKVRADFGSESEGNEARDNAIARIAQIARTEEMAPFTARAVTRLLEEAARTLGDRRKLPCQWNDLADTMREAAYWASKNSHDEIDAEDIEQTIEKRNFRLSRSESKVRELIRDRTFLVDVDGEHIGQVNALAVLNQAGYQFGRPLRITATASLGDRGVIAVDREAKLSGKTYDKAVLIITGYLRHKYAQEIPLSLSASLSFEQSYGEIEGDSASVAEILALVSALSEIPLRQDIAVTGSINQFGEVQPVGGVNEKVEGFFRTCVEVGLTGRQGVLIPELNVDNLVPARDVCDAVEAGKFHIYPVSTIDEAMEILTGVRAGEVATPGTVHGQTMAKLRTLSEAIQRLAAAAQASAGPSSETAA